jgi:hypothetical protein
MGDLETVGGLNCLCLETVNCLYLETVRVSPGSPTGSCRGADRP